MSLIGWKVGGLTGAVASALATFGPSCSMSFVAYRQRDRFPDTSCLRIVRRGLVPVTIGLAIAGGYVMARAAGSGWQGGAFTVVMVVLMLRTWINPLWILMTGGALGGLGLL
jgi:chromate transporter